MLALYSLQVFPNWLLMFMAFIYLFRRRELKNFSAEESSALQVEEAEEPSALQVEEAKESSALQVEEAI